MVATRDDAVVSVELPVEIEVLRLKACVARETQDGRIPAACVDVARTGVEEWLIR